MSKADYTPQCGWASSNQLKALIEKKIHLPKGKGNSATRLTLTQTAKLTPT